MFDYHTAEALVRYRHDALLAEANRQRLASQARPSRPLSASLGRLMIRVGARLSGPGSNPAGDSMPEPVLVTRPQPTSTAEPRWHGIPPSTNDRAA